MYILCNFKGWRCKFEERPQLTSVTATPALAWAFVLCTGPWDAIFLVFRPPVFCGSAKEYKTSQNQELKQLLGALDIRRLPLFNLVYKSCGSARREEVGLGDKAGIMKQLLSELDQCTPFCH
jgi:hypothetical protein